MKDLKGEQFDSFELELQEIHTTNFDPESIEIALKQLETVYIGLKGLIINIRKAFVKYRSELFEIRVIGDNVNLIQEGTILPPNEFVN